MTISSSLSAGVSGLSANASRLATISDNIANSGTYGYKRAVSSFHSIVGSETSTLFSAGGVKTITHREISQRGPLKNTENATDLAVRGRGMLPITSEAAIKSGGPLAPKLITTGAFYTNADGYLVTDGKLALLGWPAREDGTIPNYSKDTFEGCQPIKIDVNRFDGKATTEISCRPTLPAIATQNDSTGAPQQLSIEYFDNLARSQTLNIDFSPVVAAPTDPATNQWTMTIRDSESGGSVVGIYNMQFSSDRSTGMRLQSITIDPTSPPGSTPFDPATGKMTFDVYGGPMTLDLGKPGELNAINQISDRFSPGLIKKDGYPAGNFASVEVTPEGHVVTYYDNGINRTIAQVPLVDVPNVNGLLPHDDLTYSLTRESGQMILWGGNGPTGDIVSYAREESSTDVAGELTNLITTQRAYSSNAKVVQTVDEMLQETTNMKR